MIVIPMLFSRATTQQEQVASKDAQFYNNRGIAYAAKGQYDRAVSDFTMALEINPRDALAYYNRARAYYFKKQYYKSWRDISKAQDLGYKVPRKFLNDLRKASGRKK
jgi:tetratricopeptide (TPR) repeat protein